MTTLRTIWAATALGVLLSSCSALPPPGPQTARTTPPPATSSIATPSTPVMLPSAPAPSGGSSAIAASRTLDLRPGRGGVDGTAISIETADSNLREYLARVKEKIKRNWAYPCVKNPATQECEYKNAKLNIEFGILKNGVVAYVELRQGAGAGLETYDYYAIEAIKGSSPFPVMPPEIVVALKQGSTGMPVVVTLKYVVDVPPSLVAQSRGQASGVPNPIRGSAIRVGVVTVIAGSVAVDHPGGSQSITLRAGDAVFLQDRISTGDGARMEMVLGGKLDVAMRERSIITITERPGRSTLILDAGQVAMNVPADQVPGEELLVRTPNAVAAVRGGARMRVETLLLTQAGGVVVTHVDVLDGRTAVTISSGTPRSAIHLRANDGVTITGDVAGPIRALRTVSPPTK
jgi:hypothetical protein